MLTLKLPKKERVHLFKDGVELGWVSLYCPTSGIAEARVCFDFAPEILILRSSLLEKDPALKAELTFRTIVQAS